MCLELYKVVADKPLEALRDGFVNLAINMVSVVEPKPPKKTVSVVRAMSSLVVCVCSVTSVPHASLVSPLATVLAEV